MILSNYFPNNPLGLISTQNKIMDFYIMYHFQKQMCMIFLIDIIVYKLTH